MTRTEKTSNPKSCGMDRITCEMGDVLTVKNGATPSSKNKEYYGGEIPWITPKDLSLQGKKYITHGERNITGKGYRSCSTALLPIGSVLLSSRAPIGLLAIAKNELCTNQGFKNLIPHEDCLNNEFLYYYLKTRIEDLNGMGSGTTFKEISKSCVEGLKIHIPALVRDQEKIAAVLSALDAKIELNNRINAELEAMAKTLYDYWFVQFDFPDTNGRPYKSSGGKMVYNEKLKREIPEGWDVSTIRKIFKTSLGGPPSRNKREYWEPAEINWLSSGEKADLFVVEADEKISRKGLKNSAAKELPAGTVILSIVRHLRASILGVAAATNQSVAGIEETDAIKHCFILPLIEREIPRYMSIRTGAQQPHINKDAVDTTSFVLPPAPMLRKYTEIAMPIFKQIQNNQFQTQQMTSLRDFLLPMLMNGQVKVV